MLLQKSHYLAEIQQFNGTMGRAKLRLPPLIEQVIKPEFYLSGIDYTQRLS